MQSLSLLEIHQMDEVSNLGDFLKASTLKDDEDELGLSGQPNPIFDPNAQQVDEAEEDHNANEEDHNGNEEDHNANEEDHNANEEDHKESDAPSAKVEKTQSNSGKKAKREKEPQSMFYSDAEEYVCQNPKCRYLERKSELDAVHVYEINGSETVNICSDCYLRGYRFCLFEHDVLHLDQLDPILDSSLPYFGSDLDDNGDEDSPMETMYAHKERHHGQLRPELLAEVNDLYQYMQMIGIENPCPNHTIIDLRNQPIPTIDEED